MPKPLYPTAVTARTDTRGVFEFPATIDYRQRLQIQVRDPGYFPLYSPMIDGAKVETGGSDMSATTLELGPFRLMRRPSPRPLAVRVCSSADTPIAGAEVVVVGARTGTVRGTTDETGRLELCTWQGDAIIAIHTPGHSLHLAALPRGESSLRIVLQAADSAAESHADQSIWNVNSDAFVSAAERIFQAVEPPNPQSSTFHGMRTYLESRAALKPDEYARHLLLHASDGMALTQAGVDGAFAALKRKPELIDTAMEQLSLPGIYAVPALLAAASATKDTDQRNEWLAEALVAARGLSGKEQTFTISRLARVFLAAGQTDLAAEIATEMWSNAAHLQEVVQSGQRKLMIGESRTAGPVLALVNLQQAIRLISLTAQEIEIPRLQTEARLYRAGATNSNLAKLSTTELAQPLRSPPRQESFRVVQKRRITPRVHGRDSHRLGCTPRQIPPPD